MKLVKTYENFTNDYQSLIDKFASFKSDTRNIAKEMIDKYHQIINDCATTLVDDYDAEIVSNMLGSKGPDNVINLINNPSVYIDTPLGKRLNQSMSFCVRFEVDSQTNLDKLKQDVSSFYSKIKIEFNEIKVTFRHISGQNLFGNRLDLTGIELSEFSNKIDEIFSQTQKIDKFAI